MPTLGHLIMSCFPTPPSFPRRGSDASASSLRTVDGPFRNGYGTIEDKENSAQEPPKEVSIVNIIQEALQDSQLSSLLDNSFNLSDPDILAQGARANPDFYWRVGKTGSRVALLGVSGGGAVLFYNAAANKFVRLLVENGVIKPDKADAWTKAFQTGSSGVNFFFIASGAMTALRFFWKHTYGDLQIIRAGKRHPVYALSSITGLGIAALLAYFGTYGQFEIAKVEIANPGQRFYCNLINAVGNAAGGTGPGEMPFWFYNYVANKENRKKIAEQEKLLQATSNTVEEGIKPEIKAMRTHLIHDLQWLIGSLHNIKQEDAKRLFNDEGFRALINSLSSKDLRGKPDTFLQTALLSAVYLTRNQHPRSTYEIMSYATAISVASIPSQIGLILAALDYVNSMTDTSPQLKVILAFFAVLSPIAMVSVFGYNFAKQSSSLNSIDLSGSNINYFYLFSVFVLFALCCLSYSATAGTGLEYIGMGAVLAIALSTVLANFVPGRVEVRELFEEVSILCGDPEISKAKGFILQIQAIKNVLEIILNHVQLGNISDEECQQIFDDTAYFVFKMHGIEPASPTQTSSSTPPPSGNSSKTEEIYSWSLKGKPFATWVSELNETESNSSLHKFAFTVPDKGLTAERFIKTGELPTLPVNPAAKKVN